MSLPESDRQVIDSLFQAERERAQERFKNALKRVAEKLPGDQVER